MTPYILECIKIGTEEFHLYVPQPESVQVINNGESADVYWTRVWPAAIALSQFLLINPHYIIHKHVLELGAGLGLPSLVAAKIASAVCCSDRNPNAVQLMQQTIKYNHLNNVTCRVYDWFHLPGDLQTDVILLSDVNYEPNHFNHLHSMMTHFLGKGCTVILSTPQRLMARPFLEMVMEWCIYKEEIKIFQMDGTVFTSVFVFKK